MREVTAASHRGCWTTGLCAYEVQHCCSTTPNNVKSTIIPVALPTGHCCCCCDRSVTPQDCLWLSAPLSCWHLLARGGTAVLLVCLHCRGQKLQQLQQGCHAFPFLLLIRQASKDRVAVEVGVGLRHSGKRLWEKELCQCRWYFTSSACGMKSSCTYGVYMETYFSCQ